MTLLKSSLSALLLSLQGCTLQSESQIPTRIIEFLPVGQGLACLLRVDDRAMLVDAGPDSAGIVEILRQQGIDSLEWILLTHGHRDHVGGVYDLLGTIGVGKILVGPDTTRQWAMDSVLRQARPYGIPVDSVFRGDRLEGLGKWPSRVLWPAQGARVSGNGASVVVQMGDRFGKILLMADLEMEQESTLMLLEEDLTAQVLQVGHHGSNSSSSLAFLGRVSPEWAVIAVGENPWGHPRSEVLSRIDHVLSDSTHLLRTDGPYRVRFEWIEEFGIIPWVEP